jgi:hypothetical protein
MNETAWLIAAVPAPVVCCKLELLPLSAGHLILLRRFESAFVTGEEIKASDLFFSVLICSGTYEDGCKIRLDDKMARELESWGKELARGPKRFLRRRENVQFDFHGAVKRFVEYLSAGGVGLGAHNILPMCIPKHASKDAPEIIGSSIELLHVAALMTDLNLTFSQAVNFPFALGRHLLAANAERQGGIRVTTRDEWDAENARLEALQANPDMDALRAALAKGGGQ